MSFPRHIAIIMDGNGRWAKARLLPRAAGHRAGMERMVALSRHAFGRGAEYVTLYALSAENLARPQEEVNALFSLFREYFASHVETLKKDGIRLRVIGDLSLLPADVQTSVEEGMKGTAQGKRGTLTLAIGYGGRQEIVRAVNAAVRGGKEIDQKQFSSLLDTGELPDPDLLIRTGKEKRLSNFLLWQSAYTELYFSDKMFPAFRDSDLDRAIEDYMSRERRYGKLG